MTYYKRFTGLLLAVFLLASTAVKADEGMWLPLLLKKYNIATMQAKGFKLTADDIYSVNKSSLKDAIVLFGGGCTGEMISPEGLLLTNHHCGFSQIRSHSSVENDYITNGYWAMNRQEELPNKGLTATIIVRMEDVTAQVLNGIAKNLPEAEREKLVQQNIDKIVKEATQGTHYNASIKPYFYGNEYYMYVSETFRDVRLVGAPPQSIGNFGGDTDNWMWPRHTGDFALFRVYADANGLPADYAETNVPYKPKHHLPISLKGIEKGDFTMVFGFPGRTQEYLTSYAIDEIYNDLNPARINIRKQILDIWRADMKASDKVRIQYASKFARLSNYHKKWTGENRGLKKLNAVERKKAQEDAFQTWANSTPERKAEYGSVLQQLKQQYDKLEGISLAREYINEAAFTTELVRFANGFQALLDVYSVPNPKQEDINLVVTRLKSMSERHFKDYNKPTDKKVFEAMMPLYYNDIPKELHPSAFPLIQKQYKGNWSKYTNDVYNKTMLADQDKVMALLNNPNQKAIKALQKDPALVLARSFVENYRDQINPIYTDANDQINLLQRTYVAGLRAMQPDKKFYPDANSTMRVAYGQVDTYEPMDGVTYDYYTTMDGIMEKASTGIDDYKVPQKLVDLYARKDYGDYGLNGTMPIAFTASNHTTGGNSGSPVINGNGELIGTNFDRNWEGTMSDIMYDPDRCRNISVDVRYTLFIIDKFAGAGYLLNEMTIVKPETTKASNP